MMFSFLKSLTLLISLTNSGVIGAQNCKVSLCSALYLPGKKIVRSSVWACPQLMKSVKFNSF